MLKLQPGYHAVRTSTIVRRLRDCRLVVCGRNHFIPILGKRSMNTRSKSTTTSDESKSIFTSPHHVDIAKSMARSHDSSIQSMENVMNILQDAESSVPKKRTSPFLSALQRVDIDYLDKYTQKFGEQIYKYKVLYELNSRPYLQSNLWVLEDFNTKFDVLLNRFMTRAILPKPNSFFCRQSTLNYDSKLTYAQTVARYFVLNNIHCMQRLTIDIRQTAKTILKYDKEKDFKGDILQLRLKSQPRRVSSDPLVIRNALGGRPFRNCLPFLAMDEDVIGFLLHNKEESELLISAMKADQIEGELAFEILCKRVLFAIQEKAQVPEDERRPETVREYWEGDLVASEKKSETEKRKVIYVQNESTQNDTPNQIEEEILQPEVPNSDPTPDKASVVFVKISPVDKSKIQPVEGISPDRQIDIDYSTLNDKVLLSKFLEDSILLRNIKAIVAYKSMIPYRLMNTMYGKFPYELAINESEWYKELVSNNQDDAIKEVLVSYFDRFFARFYGIQPLEAEQWLVNLLLTLDVQPELVNDDLVVEAIEHFKRMVEKCQLIGNGQSWNRAESDGIREIIAQLRRRVTQTR